MWPCTCSQRVGPDGTSPQKTSLQTACQSGTCCGRSWWSSVKVGGPSPDRAPVGQEILERSHQTSDTDKTHHTTSLLKTREFMCTKNSKMCATFKWDEETSRESYSTVVYCLMNANELHKGRDKNVCFTTIWNWNTVIRSMIPKINYKAGNKPHVCLLYMIYHIVYLSF